MRMKCRFKQLLALIAWCLGATLCIAVALSVKFTDDQHPNSTIKNQSNYTVKCGYKNLHRDARSALRRARSPECLQLIADTSCANGEGTLYPLDLKSRCPVLKDGSVAGHYLGCLADSSDGPLLKSTVTKSKRFNSLKK